MGHTFAFIHEAGYVLVAKEIFADQREESLVPLMLLKTVLGQ